MTKKWIVDKDDGLRLFYGDENFNGSAYPCNDIVFMKMIADKLNKLEKENEQLKHDATVFIQANKDYRKENEQLKEENETLAKGLTAYFESKTKR